MKALKLEVFRHFSQLNVYLEGKNMIIDELTALSSEISGPNCSARVVLFRRSSAYYYSLQLEPCKEPLNIKLEVLELANSCGYLLKVEP